LFLVHPQGHNLLFAFGWQHQILRLSYWGSTGASHRGSSSVEGQQDKFGFERARWRYETLSNSEFAVILH
jgi:hypothetical protein